MVVDNTQKINKYYQESAWDYKNLWTKDALAMHFGYYDDKTQNHKDALIRMNNFLSKLVNINKADNVLDAGCGLGGTAIWLAENYGCKVVGLNIVPFQIQIARQAAFAKGVSDKVKFENKSYAETDFQSENFDVFWGLESIVHSPDKSKVVNESYRLLKHGGRLVVSEYMLRDNPPLTQGERHYLRPVLNGWVMPNLLTSEEYKNLMASAGFNNIKIFNISDRVSPSLKRLRTLCILTLPGAWILNQIGVFSRERFLNVRGSLRHADSFFKGLWQYTVITAYKK